MSDALTGLKHDRNETTGGSCSSWRDIPAKMRTDVVGGVVRNQSMSATLIALALIALALIAGAATLWTPVAVVLLAGVVLMLAWPVFLRLAREASWALPLVVAILVILMDVRGITSSSGLLRYAGTAIVLALVVAMRGGGARTGYAVWITAGVLCVYGLLGTFYGRFWLGTQDGALPVVLPMLICLVGWAPQVGDDAHLRFALKVIAFLGSIFALMCAAVRVAGLTDEVSVFNHEKSFLIVLAVASAIAVRSRWLTVFALGSALAAFAAYPAATYLVAGLAALLTLVLVRWSPDRTTRTLLGVGGLAGVLWAVLHVDSLVRLAGEYFTLVGKTDNGSTRAALYHTALEELTAEPVFARFFTGDLTVTTRLAGQSGVVLPIHNDYLGIAMSGGVVAATLLLAVFMFANGCAIHAVRVYGLSSTRGGAITALLASLNAAAVTAFADPVFMTPGASTAVYAIVFALISLCVGAAVRASPASGTPHREVSKPAQTHQVELGMGRPHSSDRADRPFDDA